MIPTIQPRNFFKTHSYHASIVSPLNLHQPDHADRLSDAMPTTRLQTRLGKGAPLLAGLPTPTRRPRVARAPRPMLLPVLAPVELVDVWDEESNGSSLSAAPEGLLTPSPPASRASSSALSSPPPSISSASSSAPSSSMADTHRLVAPGQEDILLTPEEHVKVLDFIRGMRQGLQSPRAGTS